MLTRPVIAISVLLCFSPMLAAQTTQPAPTVPDPRVEMRANQAFNRGEYAIALPLFNQVAQSAKDEPSRYGAIEEKIRVCQKALDSLKKNGAADSSQAAPVIQGTDIPMDAETRHKHPAPKSGEVLRMSIKELGNFNYDDENGGNIPSDVKRLSGSEISLQGYMIPMDQAQNITEFALVPSLFACCFGQPPQIQHTIVVTCPKGKELSYCPDSIVVKGKLTVQEKRDDGYIISIFEVAAESVKVAK